MTRIAVLAVLARNSEDAVRLPARKAGNTEREEP